MTLRLLLGLLAVRWLRHGYGGCRLCDV